MGPHRVGKGANVKLLVQQALSDSRATSCSSSTPTSVGTTPGNLVRVFGATKQPCASRWSCRCGLGHRGQGNTTNYLTSPLGVRVATFARVRQPLAGHMLIHRSLLEQLDLKALPDDYGIDISITLTALNPGVEVRSGSPWSRRSIRRKKATASG